MTFMISNPINVLKLYKLYFICTCLIDIIWQWDLIHGIFFSVCLFFPLSSSLSHPNSHLYLPSLDKWYHLLSVQFSRSDLSDSLQPHGLQHLSITNSQNLFKLTSIEPLVPSNHLTFRCPLLLLPSIFPSIRVIFHESVLCIRWPTYWSFSFSISPSNEYSGLISFRIDWLDLLVVQGTLKYLLQHRSSKAAVLRCSSFFIVQLRHPHMTTGKSIALTRWTFVDKVMSLLFNMMSRLVITFLPRSKSLLISWLQSPYAVIFEPKNVCHCFHCWSPSICREVMGPDAVILVFWMLSFNQFFQFCF